MANWLQEKVRDGEFITWEVNQAYTREAHEVDATAGDIEPGTVLEYLPGKFGIVINRVRRGFVGKTTLIVRGAAIVFLDLLVFPTIVAVDGADADADNVAETAAATLANRDLALLALADLGIIARN